MCGRCAYLVRGMCRMHRWRESSVRHITTHVHITLITTVTTLLARSSPFPDSGLYTEVEYPTSSYGLKEPLKSGNQFKHFINIDSAFTALLRVTAYLSGVIPLLGSCFEFITPHRSGVGFKHTPTQCRQIVSILPYALVG